MILALVEALLASGVDELSGNHFQAKRFAGAFKYGQHASINKESAYWIYLDVKVGFGYGARGEHLGALEFWQPFKLLMQAIHSLRTFKAHDLHRLASLRQVVDVF